MEPGRAPGRRGGIRIEPVTAHRLDREWRVSEPGRDLDRTVAIPASRGAPEERVLSMKSAEGLGMLGPYPQSIARGLGAGDRDDADGSDRGHTPRARGNPADDPEDAGRSR